MPASRHTTIVGFDDDLWELVAAEAAHAGVSVPQYVHDAVIARIVVGPSDPRLFELFAASVRQSMQEERDGAKRREAERSLGALARVSAARLRSEAQAVRAQSTQVLRMSHRLHDQDAAPARDPDPPGARSVFRMNPDWTDLQTVSSHPATASDGTIPDLSWLQDEHIHPDDQPRVRSAIVDAIETGGIFELRYRVRLGETVRSVYLRALPLLDTAGTITEWVAVAADVTSPGS
jgi:PAS domain-containing protein